MAAKPRLSKQTAHLSNVKEHQNMVWNGAVLAEPTQCLQHLCGRRTSAAVHLCSQGKALVRVMSSGFLEIYAWLCVTHHTRQPTYEMSSRSELSIIVVSPQGG
jgi:hypothetical protein